MNRMDGTYEETLPCCPVDPDDRWADGRSYRLAMQAFAAGLKRSRWDVGPMDDPS